MKEQATADFDDFDLGECLTLRVQIRLCKESVIQLPENLLTPYVEKILHEIARETVSKCLDLRKAHGK